MSKHERSVALELCVPNWVSQHATARIRSEVHQGYHATSHGDELLYLSLLIVLALRQRVAAEDDRGIQELGMVPHDLNEPLAAPRKAPANDGVLFLVGSWHEGS